MNAREMLLAAALASVAAAAVAENKLPVPIGGDPALACGQNPDGRAYWTEYAFCDLPVRGSAKATGLILWSHGVKGLEASYQGPPPLVIRRLAGAGWDVVKINRNNLHEHGWVASGPKYVDDLVQRARQARAQGYQRVMAAGQSYGAISVEANARTPDLFYAVFAMSPGHGSDSPAYASSGGLSRDAYYNLDKYLLETLAGQHNGRIVVSLPPGDTLHPNRDGDPIGPKVRDALRPGGLPFVHFDKSLPITGHGAAYTQQFDAWFGDCIRRFLDPQTAPPPGETRCPPPDPLPAFLLPADLKVPAPGTAGTQRWLGAWKGKSPQTGRELMIVVEKAEGDVATVVYALDAGPGRDLTMGYGRYTKARLNGNAIVVERGQGAALELSLAADSSTLIFIVRSPAGGSNYTVNMARALETKL